MSYWNTGDFQWFFQPPLGRVPPGLIAGLIKGNQRFVSPDHKGPRLILGGVYVRGGVGWPVMIFPVTFSTMKKSTSCPQGSMVTVTRATQTISPKAENNVPPLPAVSRAPWRRGCTRSPSTTCVKRWWFLDKAYAKMSSGSMIFAFHVPQC